MALPSLLKVALVVAVSVACAVTGESNITQSVATSSSTTPLPSPLPPAEVGGSSPVTKPAQRPGGRPPQSYFERLPLESRPFGQLEGFSPRQGPPLRTCHRPAVCQPLRYGAGHSYGSACLGTALRFASTSLNLTGFSSQESLKVLQLRRRDMARQGALVALFATMCLVVIV